MFSTRPKARWAVVNQPAAHISFADLSGAAYVIPAAELDQASGERRGVKVLKGGPVGYPAASCCIPVTSSSRTPLPIDEGICLTATLASSRRRPRVGCSAISPSAAGWAPGQLENEIQHNGWLHCAADAELIFGQDTGGKYEKALKKIGIALGMLSSEAGHA
jgi:putative transcriptional regulator